MGQGEDALFSHLNIIEERLKTLHEHCENPQNNVADREPVSSPPSRGSSHNMEEHLGNLTGISTKVKELHGRVKSVETKTSSLRCHQLEMKPGVEKVNLEALPSQFRYRFSRILDHLSSVEKSLKVKTKESSEGESASSGSGPSSSSGSGPSSSSGSGSSSSQGESVSNNIEKELDKIITLVNKIDEFVQDDLQNSVRMKSSSGNHNQV